MSFYSALILCHAAPPPQVTCATLGQFVRQIAETGAVAADNHLVCQIKFGERVDRDLLTTDVGEWDKSGLIETLGEYHWDYSEEFTSLAAMATALQALPTSVYRAYLNLGGLHDDIVAVLTREPCEDNNLCLCLCELSLEVGPIFASGLASEALNFAGWIGLSFSGYGYFFPWTYKEARLRAESNELVGRLVQACKRTWPILPMAPTSQAVMTRREIGELWLYDDLALPTGWIWIVSETG